MARDFDPDVAFDTAIEAGNFTVAKQLLASHPEILANDLFLNQIASCATLDDRTDILAFLLDLGLDLNVFCRLTPHDNLIYLASASGHADTIRWLLANGCDLEPEYKGRRHCAALSSACVGGHFDTVKVLVEAGAEVNSVLNGGNALSYAITFGHYQIVDYLRSKGAKTPEELGLALPPQPALKSKPKKGKK